MKQVRTLKGIGSCARVYELLAELRDRQKRRRVTRNYAEGMELIEKLENAFCDFECSWKEHARLHGGK